MLPVDIHTHSIASGHATTDTITTMAKEASNKGIQLLAITEHGPATKGSCSVSYFRGLKNAPRQRFGVNLLYGCEVNILDYEGHLDLDDSLLSELDLNIASLHTQNIKPGSIEQNTNAVIAAIRNPYIHILGHPDDEKYELDYDKIIREAMKNKVLLELNNGSLRKGSYRGNSRPKAMEYLKICKNYLYPIVLGSDSHGKEQIGEFEEALELLAELNIPKELVMNYRLTDINYWFN